MGRDDLLVDSVLVISAVAQCNIVIVKIFGNASYLSKFVQLIYT